jgi:hypothetical protein
MSDRPRTNPLLPSSVNLPRAPTEADVYATAYLARARQGITASHAVISIAAQSASPGSEGALWESAFLAMRHPL